MLDLKVHVFQARNSRVGTGRRRSPSRDRGRDRRRLLPQCRLRFCDLPSWEAGDRWASRSPVVISASYSGSGWSWAWRWDLRCRRSSLGLALVRPLTGNRRGRDDVDLCERSRPDRRGTTNGVSARQARGVCGRRRARSADLHPAVRVGRSASCCSGHTSFRARRPPARARVSRSRRARPGGEGGQDECQAGCREGLGDRRIGRALTFAAVRARTTRRGGNFAVECTAGLGSQTPGRASTPLRAERPDLGSRARLSQA